MRAAVNADRRARIDANLNATVANRNNPRHWSNWNRNWNNYGVAPYQRDWYRGAWSGFYGPGYYTPFGFGYSGYGYGRGFGLGGLGYGYSGLGGWGYGYGLNPWLLNSLGYRWGYYGGFYNPYYASNYAMPYNYAQPVYLTYYEDDRSPPPAADDVDDARLAFRRGEYERALDLLDRAVKENPSDTAAHELRALALFALGRYGESAATLNALLAVAPGWNWETMISLYPNVDTYTRQLRDLEGFTKEDREDAASRFVLGYHYLVAGHMDAASRQFEKVTELQPKDRVAQQLLSGLQKDDSAAASERIPEPAPDERFRDGEETDLIGKWTAKGDKAPPVALELTDDGQFHWIAGEGEKATQVEGKYEVDGQTLTLDGGKNESLVGHLASEGKDRFHFKLLGSPPDDPGLEFERAR
jgi:tetratricopeptide (TPR) repeat protein